jgi:hypothetical protein
MVIRNKTCLFNTPIEVADAHKIIIVSRVNTVAYTLQLIILNKCLITIDYCSQPVFYTIILTFIQSFDLTPHL